MQVHNVVRQASPSLGSKLLRLLYTAAPVSIDPCMLVSGYEAIFERPEIEGARRRRHWNPQGGGREDLLGFDAHHKALAKEASRDGGRRAQSDPREALQDGGDAPRVAAQ